MHYYDHHHDPNTHPQLTRQHEDELLRPPRRREIRLSLLARLRTLIRRAMPARPAGDDLTISSRPRDATSARRGPERDPKPTRLRSRAPRARPPG
jgi:hypothetical protein